MRAGVLLPTFRVQLDILPRETRVEDAEEIAQYQILRAIHRPLLDTTEGPYHAAILAQEEDTTWSLSAAGERWSNGEPIDNSAVCQALERFLAKMNVLAPLVTIGDRRRSHDPIRLTTPLHADVLRNYLTDIRAAPTRSGAYSGAFEPFGNPLAFRGRCGELLSFVVMEDPVASINAWDAGELFATCPTDFAVGELCLDKDDAVCCPMPLESFLFMNRGRTGDAARLDARAAVRSSILHEELPHRLCKHLPGYECEAPDRQSKVADVRPFTIIYPEYVPNAAIVQRVAEAFRNQGFVCTPRGIPFQDALKAFAEKDYDAIMMIVLNKPREIVGLPLGFLASLARTSSNRALSSRARDLCQQVLSRRAPSGAYEEARMMAFRQIPVIPLFQHVGAFLTRAMSLRRLRDDCTLPIEHLVAPKEASDSSI
jgi:hypothetical protein